MGRRKLLISLLLLMLVLLSGCRFVKFFKTRLLGPEDLEKASGVPSCPYIVVKMQNRKDPVEFL